MCTHIHICRGIFVCENRVGRYETAGQSLSTFVKTEKPGWLWHSGFGVLGFSAGAILHDLRV